MIRVLVVDDSPVVRRALEQELGKDPRLEVVGVAEDPVEAMRLLPRVRPQVMTLDVEMPKMDGLTFLRELMQRHAMPVVMCSSLARRSSELVLECLRAGAVSMVPKPHSGYALPQMIADLRHAVVAASTARVQRRSEAPGVGKVVAASAPRLSASARGGLVAIGSSTGGTSALEEVLRGLPADGPAVVVAQHLPEAFVPRFVERLNRVLPQTVRMARGGENVAPGTVHIAPATHHMGVRRQGTQLVTYLDDGPKVNFHRPSVDVLFHSVAACASRRTVAVMLTGMGRDGAEGMAAIRAGGGRTIAQDEATSVVYGMPRAAVERGAVQQSVPLPRIASKVIEAMAGLGRAAA